MRTVRRIMLDQARAARERAAFYRRLASTLGKQQAASTFEKSARELDLRADEMEKYAGWFENPDGGAPSGRDTSARDPEASDGNAVNRLQRAIQLAVGAANESD